MDEGTRVLLGKAAAALMSVAAELRDLFPPSDYPVATARAGWVIERRSPSGASWEWWTGRYWTGDKKHALVFPERREAWVEAGKMPAADVALAFPSDVLAAPHVVEPEAEPGLSWCEPCRSFHHEGAPGCFAKRRGGAVERFFAERDEAFRAARPDLARVLVGGEWREGRPCETRRCIRPFGHDGQHAIEGGEPSAAVEVVHLFARDTWRRRCDGGHAMSDATHAPERATCRACLAALRAATEARARELPTAAEAPK